MADVDEDRDSHLAVSASLTEADKLLFSETLKRHPKMEVDKGDLLQLLSYMEGELQARDVTIAALRLEKVRTLLSRAKYGCASVSNPVNALQHDSDVNDDTSYDDVSVRAMYSDQLTQLENLIARQHVCQHQMREQLVAVEKQYHSTCAELEQQKKSHELQVEELNVVIQLLDRDKDRLQQQVDSERSRCKKLEKDLKSASAAGVEDHSLAAKHRQVALLLIRERSRLVSKLLETRQHGADLERQLGEERDRVQSLTGELDRQLAECDQLCSRLSCAESLNRSLQAELTQLQSIPQTTAAVVAGLNRPTQSPHFAVPTTPASDLQHRHTDSEWSRSNGPVSIAADASPRSAFGASPVVGMPPLDEISRQQSPRDRDIAAARLRSILTSAMDASRITAAASEAGPSRSVVRLPSPGVYPPDRRPPSVNSRSVPVPWSRLPEMTTAGSGSMSSSGIAPTSLQNLSLAADTSKPPPSSAESRPLGRLAPLVAPPGSHVSYSPRLEPSAGSVPGQSNGLLSTFTGGVPRKPSSTYGSAK